MPKIITDIIPPSRRRQNEANDVVRPSAVEEHAPSMDMIPPHSSPPPIPAMASIPPGGNRKKFPVGYVIAAVVVVLASLGLLFAFGGATVELTPMIKEVSVSGSFSATPSSGNLPYETATVELTAEKVIDAEGEETVDIPAQGTITIYNTQSKVQELIKNTRFETPEGLIFRIHDSVRIPAGTGEKPGQLHITVYADVGGTAYNIGPSSFTLPGLKSSPAYTQVYAKSEESMVGGFTGMRPSVTETARKEAYTSMQEGLESSLREKISENVKEGYVLIPGAVFLSFVPLPDGTAPSDSVKLVQKGTATAFIFPQESLAKTIAAATLGVYTGESVTLRGVDMLTFTAESEDAEETFVPTPAMELLPFTLTGTTHILWLVDSKDVALAIAGKSRNAAKTILAGFGELEKARLILKPFWKGSLPTNPDEIKIVVKEPKTP